MSGTERILRAHALRIFHAALKAADPKEGIYRHCRMDGETLVAGGRRYPLGRFRRILVIGAGKASANMAVAVEKLLGKRISDGLINTKHGHTARLRRIRLNECGHPVPDEDGVRGAGEIAEIAAGAERDDLVICLISGGASALLPLPAEGITLADKQATTGLLLACGANIHEINTVRKHISRVKGGQLAALAHPATVLSLILSDVTGDDLAVIGSGVTAPDQSTFADAISVLRRFDLLARVPPSVLQHLQAARQETPKPGDDLFRTTRNLIIGSNWLALQAARQEAAELGYRTSILSSYIEGETRDVAGVHAAIAREILATGQPVRRPACVLSGGETTVTIRGDGKGGRNQEFALAAAVGISGLQNTVVLSGGTDGTDGPTDAAGGLCDGNTTKRLAKAGTSAQDALLRNDSYHALEQSGDLVKTGPTGTNVMDVRIVLVGKETPH